SVDPAGIVDGPNPYQYARQNPVRFVDETGNESSLPPMIAEFPEVLKVWHEAADKVLIGPRYKNMTAEQKLKELERWIEEVERTVGKGSNRKEGTAINEARKAYFQVREQLVILLEKRGYLLPPGTQLHHYLRVGKFPKKALDPHVIGPQYGHASVP